MSQRELNSESFMSVATCEPVESREATFSSFILDFSIRQQEREVSLRSAGLESAQDWP